MPIHLDESLPVDNTKVISGPFRVFPNKQQAKRYNDAYNDAIAANAEGLYSILRFTPYIKYMTDVGDFFGYNPSAYWKYKKTGERSYDPTDMMGIAGNASSFYFNKLADKYEKPGTITTTVGRRHPRKINIKTGPGNTSAKFFRAFGKYNPVKQAGVAGDVVQGSQAFKGIVDANDILDVIDYLTDWQHTPRIDTSNRKYTNNLINKYYK